MLESIEKAFGGKESDSLAKSGYDGEIPCVLVYPDRKHVSYINNLVNCLEEKLPELGFKLSKLCDKTPPDEHFGEHFEKLAEECILGIVILDGFRPNVLFEYGFLRGKGKTKMQNQTKRKNQIKNQTKNQKQETQGKTTNHVSNKDKQQTRARNNQRYKMVTTRMENLKNQRKRQKQRREKILKNKTLNTKLLSRKAGILDQTRRRPLMDTIYLGF